MLTATLLGFCCWSIWRELLILLDYRLNLFESRSDCLRIWKIGEEEVRTAESDFTAAGLSLGNAKANRAEHRLAISRSF